MVSPTSSPSPLRNSPGFTPGSCDLIRAAPYRLMEDIRDPHSMPHSPVNYTGPHNRIGSDHELWGEKLHGNREVPTSDRLRAKLHRDANFA